MAANFYIHRHIVLVNILHDVCTVFGIDMNELCSPVAAWSAYVWSAVDAKHSADRIYRCALGEYYAHVNDVTDCESGVIFPGNAQPASAKIVCGAFLPWR
jgi:hypothetical protein